EEGQEGQDDRRLATARGRPRWRALARADTWVGPYLPSSSSDFIVSVRSAASALAAPGSPGRSASTSAPSLTNVTRSSFLPSSNFTWTSSAGLRPFLP